MPESSAVTHPNPLPRRALVLVSLLVFVALGVALWLRFAPSASGADSSGYLNSAKLFAAGKLEAPIRQLPEIAPYTTSIYAVPLGFWPSPRPGRMVPTYPPGLPLQYAAVGPWLGWELGPTFVSVALALAAVWLCYQCAREIGLDAGLAIACAAALALSPLFLFLAQQTLSDVPAATWCLAAVWAALRADRQRSVGWAAFCGVALGIAVLVRPTSVLLLPCLVILLANWRLLLAAGVGGLPVALWLGYYQHHLYGSAFRSGYGDIWFIMRLKWVGPSLQLYAEWLPVLFPAVLLVLPFGALFAWSSRRRVILALAAWWLAIGGFYAFYQVTHEVWWCLRFILPGIPALLLGGTLGLDVLLQQLRSSWRERSRLAATLALIVWAVVCWSLKPMPKEGLQQGQMDFRDAALWLRARAPADSVVICMTASGTIFYYTDLTLVRWDQINRETSREFTAALRRTGRPVYALLEKDELPDVFDQRMKDRWEALTQFGHIGIWQLAP